MIPRILACKSVSNVTENSSRTNQLPFRFDIQENICRLFRCRFSRSLGVTGLVSPSQGWGEGLDTIPELGITVVFPQSPTSTAALHGRRGIFFPSFHLDTNYNS